jgi:hypothetical protein
MSRTKNAPPLTTEDAQRRDAAAQRIQDYITVTVATAPPLTEAQRVDLIRQIAGGGDAL